MRSWYLAGFWSVWAVSAALGFAGRAEFAAANLVLLGCWWLVQWDRSQP